MSVKGMVFGRGVTVGVGVSVGDMAVAMGGGGVELRTHPVREIRLKKRRKVCFIRYIQTYVFVYHCTVNGSLIQAGSIIEKW